ncbi:MAG: hypothetical protein HQL31_09125 [Planctomycetes bacterium]|nr:hypothetical protein [Planctomycetota bacterium]
MSKDKFEAYHVIADHYDQIHNMNPGIPEQQILETISKATGVALSTVKKRWKFMTSVDWPLIDYVERGVISLTRVSLVVDLEIPLEEKTELMNRSLNEKVSDTNFKDFLARYMEARSA